MFRIILATIILFAGFGFCLAQDNKVILKAGTEFFAKLETPINVDKAKVGDDLNFKLVADLNGEGITILKDSEVYGRVIEVEKISANHKTSKVSVIFDYIKYGEDFLPLSAVVVTVKDVPDQIKCEESKANHGNTNMTLEGKNLVIEAGKQLQVKLVKDVNSTD